MTGKHEKTKKLEYIDIDDISYIDISEFSDSSPVIEVNPELILPTIQQLREKGLSHLSTIIGLQINNSLVSLYPLSGQNPKYSQTLFVKTIVPIENPTLDSIERIFPTANAYEREITDLFGIKYNNVYNREKLVLPEGFPDDIFPLRKEFSSKQLKDKLDELGLGTQDSISIDEPSKYSVTETNDSDYSISVGPQHPTHKEPIRFQFFVKGENIEDVKLRIGFNHRGIEKALEMNSWLQNLYLIERICGICSAAHQLAYSVTAEKIVKIEHEIPDRAQWLRVLVAELERIHSHMLWYGVLAHDAGYDMMFHISWRDRELVMDLLEKLTGNRVNYSWYAIGGVQRNITADLQHDMVISLKKLRKKVIQHKDVMINEKSFIGRLANVGVLGRDEAIKYCAVGPTARSSNVNFDLRRDVPYVGYKDIPFNIHTESQGDVLASLVVRLDETIESVDMCIYILENLPTGEIRIKVPNRLPVGDAYTRMEAPRGENIHYLRSDGGKGPERHKVRAPTLSNIVSLLERFKNMQIADIPMIIRLIDPCIGCMERVTFVDMKTQRSEVISGQELINKSIKKYRDNKEIKLFW